MLELLLELKEKSTQRKTQSAFLIDLYGGAKRIRTADLFDVNEAL